EVRHLGCLGVMLGFAVFHLVGVAPETKHTVGLSDLFLGYCQPLQGLKQSLQVADLFLQLFDLLIERHSCFPLLSSDGHGGRVWLTTAASWPLCVYRSHGIRNSGMC